MAASDTILEVGALINLTQFSPGLEKMAADTAVATGKMSTSFTSLAGSTVTSTSQMMAGFHNATIATQEIIPAVEKVTQHTRTHTTEMGTWWERLANTIRGSVGGIIGSLSGMDAKMSESAERARLGVGTMESAFAGLSHLLGAGIAVGFAAHFLDESARVVIELKHLETATSIGIQTLAGLRAVAQQLAIPFETLQVSLIRMQRAQVLAVEGGKGLQNAFERLGISVDELRNLNPEQLFFRLAHAINQADNTQIAAASSMQILGRGSLTLIPLLRQVGDGFEDYVGKAGKASGVTESSAAAAEKWHKMTAELAQTFQSFMIPALEVIVPITRGMLTTFTQLIDLFRNWKTEVRELGSTLTSVWGYVTSEIEPVKAAFSTIHTLMGYLVIGADTLKEHFITMIDAIKEKIQSAIPHFTLISKAIEEVEKFMAHATAGMKASMEGVNKSILLANPALLLLKNIWDAFHDGKKTLDVEVKAGDLSGLEGKGDKGLSEFQKILDDKARALDAFHAISVSEEIAFWEKILNTHKLSSKQQEEIIHKLVELKKETARQTLEEDLSLDKKQIESTKSGTIQRVQAEQDVLDKLKALRLRFNTETGKLEEAPLSPNLEAKINEQEGRVFAAQTVFEDHKRKLAVDTERLKVEETTRGTIERVNAERVFMELVRSLYGEETSNFTSAQSKMIEATRAFNETQKQIRSIDADAERAHQQSLMEIQKIGIEAQYATGLINRTQRLDLLKQLLDQEYALELQNLQRKADLYKRDPVAYERVQKEILALTDRYNKEIAQNDSSQLRDRTEKFRSFGRSIAQDFSNTLGEMMRGQKTFAQGMVQIWNNMVVHFTQILAQMLLKWVGHKLAELLFHNLIETHKTTSTVVAQSIQTAAVVAAQTAQTAAIVAAQAGQAAAIVAASAVEAAAKKAAGTASDSQGESTGIVHDAATAAANTFSKVIKALPFPLNVIVAPIAAAGVFMAIMAYKSFLSAEKGALLDQDTLVQAHKGELIVPARFVPSVMASVKSTASGGGMSAGIAQSSVSPLVSSAINAMPAQEGSLPKAIRSQFESISTGTAEKGALLPQDALVHAHANEMILPAPISTGLQNVINTRAFNPPPAMTQSFGGASTSTSTSSVTHNSKTVHVRPMFQIQVNGNDDGIKDLHDKVVSAVRLAMRRGSLEPGY